MHNRYSFWICCWALLGGSATLAAATDPAAAPAKPAPSTAEILAASPPSAWRPLVDEHTLYLELAAGRVIIELDPAMAPHTVANIEALVRMHWFDGAAVVRVQDNFVAQWSNPDTTRKLPDNLRLLPPEFTAPAAAATFTELADQDGYAPQVGFIDSFPAARDPAIGQAWLAHCYGAVGVGRDNDPATGNGSELYAVIGQAPRWLDRNVTVVGRVRQGIEYLASLPRGTAAMGFYATPKENVGIIRVTIAADMPPAQRTRLEVLRTDSPTYGAVVESRRNRTDAWYLRPAGYIDLCSAPLPVRAAAASPN
jgi:peptidylprolyl isomerase